MQVNVGNEKIKWKFLGYLRKRNSYCEKTILKVEQALNFWDKFSANLDYKKFSEKMVLNFKEKLMMEVENYKKSPGNAVQKLNFMYNFFQWLRRQPGYKSRIPIYIIEFFKPGRKLRLLAKSHSNMAYPSLSEVLKICDNIKINSVIDERNRVIIPIIVLSAIRIEALATLPICCFDPEKFMINMDPGRGVKTKFGKHIITYLMRFDDQLVKYVEDWYDRLKDMGYSGMDPFIPAAAPKRQDGLCFAKSKELCRKFLRPARIRNIVEEASVEAGMGRVIPHSLRHLHVALARKIIIGKEEEKAISQNISHEKPITSFYYGVLPKSEVEILISKINSRKRVPKEESFTEEEFKSFLEYKKFQEMDRKYKEDLGRDGVPNLKIKEKNEIK